MYTLAQAAEMLGISETAARNWIKSGKLLAHSVTKGARQVWMVDEEDLQECLASQASKGEANTEPNYEANSASQPPAVQFFENLMQRYDDRVDQLTSQINALAEEKGEYKGALAQLREEVSQRQRDIVDLRTIIDGMREQVASRDETLRVYRDDIDRLENDNQRLREELATAQDEAVKPRWPWMKKK